MGRKNNIIIPAILLFFLLVSLTPSPCRATVDEEIKAPSPTPTPTPEDEDIKAPSPSPTPDDEDIKAPSPSPTPEDEDINKVLDSEGNPLEVGSEYYIRPAGIGFRGGITRIPKPGHFWCPLYVIESPSEVDPGTPVKFIPYPELNQTSHINLSSKLEIDSGFSAYCRDDGIWRLKFDAWSRRYEVIASGVFDVPRTWFTIEKSETDVGPAYMIATEIGVLGASNDIVGLRVLGVPSVDPEPVLFIKKKTDYDIVIGSATNKVSYDN